MLQIRLAWHFTHIKLFFRITEIETLTNIAYSVGCSSLNRCFCVLLLTVLVTKLSLPICHGRSPRRIEYIRRSHITEFITFLYVEEAGCDVSGVVDFVEIVNCCKL